MRLLKESDPDFAHAEHGDVAEVVAHHGPWRDHDFYVSGSAPMVKATLRTLAAPEVPSTRIT